MNNLCPITKNPRYYKMKVTLLVPTLSRFDLLKRLLRSEEDQTRRADNIIIIDNSNGKLGKLRGQIVSANNLGVAGSWNLGLNMLKNEKDHLLIIGNDDNKLTPIAIEEFVRLAEENPTHGFFGTHGALFSLFAVRPDIAIKTIGYFDDGFYPAYYEDNDYHYRMKLAGLDFIYTNKELFELGVDGAGSQTLNSSITSDEDRDMIFKGFQANKSRYKAKWGGEPHKEKYTTPFNLHYEN